METLIVSMTVIMAVNFLLVLRALWRLERLAEDLRDAAHGIEKSRFRVLGEHSGDKSN